MERIPYHQCPYCENVAICKYTDIMHRVEKAMINEFQRQDNPKGSTDFISFPPLVCQYHKPNGKYFTKFFSGGGEEVSIPYQSNRGG